MPSKSSIRSLGFALRLLSVFGAVFQLSVHAYVINQHVWANGTVIMQLQLGAAPSPLTDGSASFNTPAQRALTTWNQYMVRTQLASVFDSNAGKVNGNGLNNVFFSDTVYGTAWGTRILGITLTRYNTATNLRSETDVLINTSYTWDSYSGVLRHGTNAAYDIARVLLHEFGHVIGLQHPDDAGQSVDAVMNSVTSDTDHLTSDDISGVTSIYGTTVVAPVITTQPVAQTALETDKITLSVAAQSSAVPSYSWVYGGPDGSFTTIKGATSSAYTINLAESSDSGLYYAFVSNQAGYVTSQGAAVSVKPLTTSPDTRLLSLSTRGNVGTGPNVLIAGFVVTGSPKKMLIRAIGPTLSTYNVPGVLANPVLDIYDSSNKVIAHNDNWGDNSNADQIVSTAARVAAAALTKGSLDSALLLQLQPGAYTAIVSGSGDTTGVALVEAYDADDAITSTSGRVISLSTRGTVTGDAGALIAGFSVNGPGPKTLLIRAVGPTLAQAPFTLSGAIDDPFLTLYQGQTSLRTDDDWDTPISSQPALNTAAARVGAFPLAIRRDSAMLVTLQPGTYTAQVTGFNGSTGVALIEVYEMP